MQHIVFPSLCLTTSQSVVTINLNWRLMWIVGISCLSERCWVTQSFIFQQGHLLDSISYSHCTSDHFGQYASSVLFYTYCEDPTVSPKVNQLPSDLSVCYCWYDISSLPTSFTLDVMHCCALETKVIFCKEDFQAADSSELLTWCLRFIVSAWLLQTCCLWLFIRRWIVPNYKEEK